MLWAQCPRCKQYKLNPHNCHCQLFLCWHEDTKDIPEECQEIYAQDDEDAAEEMAKQWYGVEMTAQQMTIFVKKWDSEEEPKPWLVEPQIELHFYARAA